MSNAHTHSRYRISIPTLCETRFEPEKPPRRSIKTLVAQNWLLAARREAL